MTTTLRMYSIALLGAFAIMDAQAQAPAERGKRTIAGSVVDAVGGIPVPYADVALDGGRPVLSDGEGRFTVVVSSRDSVRLRVRRIGFAPTEVVIAPSANSIDSVRVPLQGLSIQLDRVSVTAEVCPGNRNARADTSLVRIYEQVRLNAERSELFGDDLLHSTVLERILADVPRPGAVRVLRVDTVDVSGAPGSRYSAGGLVGATRSGDPADARGRIIVPQLVDFAGDAFAAAHCFHYTGLVTIDGERLARVEFDPVRSLKVPDVRGALYLDAKTYQLRRSMLFLDRDSPVLPRVETWHVQVDTRYREVLPSLSVLDGVCARTTRRLKAAAEPPRDNKRLGPALGPASVEEQRLVAVRLASGDTISENMMMAGPCDLALKSGYQ